MDLVQRKQIKLVHEFTDTCQLTAHTEGGASYHGLIDGVGGLVRKDAGGQAGNNLDHVDFVRCLQHVIIDVDVVSLRTGKKRREDNI